MDKTPKCRYCGSDMELISYLGYPDDNGGYLIKPAYFFKCRKAGCQVCSPSRETKEEAEAAAFECPEEEDGR
ncbi:MAG: hypothetical protein II897_04145 [Clostridia bacterium]|nr:hypothetical protein [Clostridia bacterium]